MKIVAYRLILNYLKDYLFCLKLSQNVIKSSL